MSWQHALFVSNPLLRGSPVEVRSLCCDAKIVLAKGMEFPDCPNHLKLTTVWKEMTVEQLIPRALELRRKDAA